MDLIFAMSYIGITLLFVAASDCSDMFKGHMVFAMLAAVITDIFAERLINARMLAGLDHHIGELTLATGTCEVLSH
jgi:hypothetical protein